MKYLVCVNIALTLFLQHSLYIYLWILCRLTAKINFLTYYLILAVTNSAHCMILNLAWFMYICFQNQVYIKVL